MRADVAVTENRLQLYCSKERNVSEVSPFA